MAVEGRGDQHPHVDDQREDPDLPWRHPKELVEEAHNWRRVGARKMRDGGPSAIVEEEG